MINVVKRSGKVESFDCNKIKKAVKFACQGLSVNPLELESKFDEFLVDNVTTKALQDNLVLHAKNLSTPQNDEWLLVAGRLETMNRWNVTRAYEKPFLTFFKEMQLKGLWVNQAFNVYSEDDIVYFGSLIEKDRDLQHTIASVETAEDKYLAHGECIQHMFMGNAMLYASVEKPENRRKYVADWYKEFSMLEFSLASPQLMNLRKGINNASCFIIAPDDTLDSIYTNIHNAAKISKSGGGIGFYAGFLRAKGSSLMGVDGAAGGVLPFIKVVNDTAVAVNQAGKRKGAVTVALPAWHFDIVDFLDIQTEVGDPRSKSFDIQPQVTIPDLFMEKLFENKYQEWLTFCPYEVKKVLGIDVPYTYGDSFVAAYNAIEQAYKDGLLKVVKPYIIRDLWIEILQVAFETGKPYVAYTCEINRKNPNKHDGVILCVNLCTESFSNTKPDVYAHTCSLASLAVGRIAVKDLSDKASKLTRILDNGIEITTAPIDISQNHMNDYRTIGIGIQGLCDIIAREWKTYEDTNFITEIAERIQYGAVRESIQLAKERGAYPKFKGSRWDTGEQFDDYIAASVCPDLNWHELKDECKKYGIRNSQLTSPAPNTSTSIFMMAGAGVMPQYEPYFLEDNKNGKTPVSSMYLKDNPLFYAKSFGMYIQSKLTKAVGALQKFVDTGISAEYRLDRRFFPNLSALDIDDIYKQAWLNKNKAVYYLRTEKQKEKDEEVCVACSG